MVFKNVCDYVYRFLVSISSDYVVHISLEFEIVIFEAFSSWHHVLLHFLIHSLIFVRITFIN
jgi:hypothetical protein